MSYFIVTVENGEVTQNIVQADSTTDHVIELEKYDHSISIEDNTVSLVEVSHPAAILPIHQHTHEDITDFNSSVNSLIPVQNIVAGDYINISHFNGIYTVKAVGLQPVGNYSVVGHSHSSSDITDFNSSVSGLLPEYDINSGSYIEVIKISDTEFTISATGLQPSGNYSIDGHNHQLSDIIDFSTGVSGLLPTITGIGYISSSFNNNTYIIEAIGLQPSGDYSIVGHSHYSSDILDFDITVSGLLPVKDIIAGTDIDIVNNSGIFTISSSNTVSTDTLEPDGFVNRTDSQINFNNTNREFSIGPKNPATSYTIYSNGIKIIKSTVETLSLPNSTALYYIHFDKNNNNSLSYKTTGINFLTDIPIAQIYFNADYGKAVYFGEERHGIKMDSATHKYLHNVFGTQYINGLSISNYNISGDGSNNSDATISISDGLIYDEDIDANIIHSNIPSNPFEQILNPVAQIPVYYKAGSNGAWTDTTANNYPIKTGTTIQYNLNNSGTWTASNSANPNNDRFIAYWICATTQENAPIISIMGQRIDSSLIQSQSNNTWGNLDLTGLPIVELRPLYRLIYNTKSTFINDPKGFLIDILDIRSHIDTVTGLTQNDHGNLYGLADDDHTQYIHIDNNRTIDAIHTFTNGLISNGLINSTNGDFDNLTVGSTPVSVSGHLHQSSDITDFDTTVSGLLPVTNIISGNNIYIDQIGTEFTISITGSLGLTTEQVDDRISQLLISGNNIELNYDDNLNTLTIGTTGLQPSGNYSLVGHNHSSTDINDFNSAVSGLFPITDINAGSNISVTQLGTVFTISITGSLGLTTEEVDDRVSNLLVAGSGINLNYNDSSNTLTISSIGKSILSDVVGSTNYIGSALYGSSTSSSVWTIHKTVYTSGGSISSSTIATNVKWDDRLTATYS